MRLGIVIHDHDALIVDEGLIPILVEKQQEVIKHFDNDVQSSLQDVEEAIRDRWKRISVDLKKRDPLSHKRLDIALFREKMYKESV